jgi:hypothetical protein
MVETPRLEGCVGIAGSEQTGGFKSFRIAVIRGYGLVSFSLEMIFSWYRSV